MLWNLIPQHFFLRKRNIYYMQKIQAKAMIFAAGLGTRLKPLTDTKPKALVEFNGRTLLEYAILKLKFYGVTEIVINVHHMADQIISYVNEHDFGVKIYISDESEELLNTGGGLVKAKDFFTGNDPFIVYNVDIISSINLYDLYQYHKKHNALVTLAVCDRETARYFLFDKENKLCGWENKSSEKRIIINKRDSYNCMAFSGIQVVQPSIFETIIEDGAFSITDLYLRLSHAHTIVAYNHTNDFWLDVGKFHQLNEVEDQLANQNLEFII